MPFLIIFLSFVFQSRCKANINQGGRWLAGAQGWWGCTGSTCQIELLQYTMFLANVKVEEWRPSLLSRRPSLLGRRPSLLGRRPSLLGWRPSLLGWRPSLLGRRPSLSGWRPSLLGWRPRFWVGGHRFWVGGHRFWVGGHRFISLLGWRPSLLGRRPSLLGRRPSLLGWRPSQSLLGWRPSLLGRRPSLLGRRPSLLGWRPSLFGSLKCFFLRWRNTCSESSCPEGFWHRCGQLCRLLPHPGLKIYCGPQKKRTCEFDEQMRASPQKGHLS